MRRREFLRLAAFVTVAAAVPMVAFASGKPKSVEAITFDQIEEVRRMFDAADVPDPYLVVHPETMKRIKSVSHFDGIRYEGFTWIECDEIIK